MGENYPTVIYLSSAVQRGVMLRAKFELHVGIGICDPYGSARALGI